MSVLTGVTVLAYVLLLAMGWRQRRRGGPQAGWPCGVPPTKSRLHRPVMLPRWSAAVGLGLLGVAICFPWGVGAAGLVPARRWFREASLRRRGDAAWSEGVDVLVLLVELGLSGGVSVRRALADALPWLGAEVGTELGLVLSRVERGASLADELEALASGSRPQLGGLARVVAATERHGSPAAAGLATVTVERRLDERQRLERAARRVPVQLLVPLVGGVLPAFVLLSVVPMLAGALGNLRGLHP